jgi:hypothetical protein
MCECSNTTQNNLKRISELHVELTIHYTPILSSSSTVFRPAFTNLCVFCLTKTRNQNEMASISHLNQFPCKTLSVNQSKAQFTSKPAISAPNSVKIGPKRIGKSWIRAGEFIRERRSFRVRAVNDDEWGPDKEEGPYAAAVAVVEEAKPAELSEIDRLKKALVDSFYGTDRGLKATSETRAEIVELITQLEAKNPTPAPTEALSLLNGKWILA